MSHIHNNFFCFQYSGDIGLEFLFSDPPFWLVITLSNYDNDKKCEQVFTNDLINLLPQNIDEVIKNNKEIQDYILSFDDDWFLHIDIKFYNNSEYICGEFYSKNVKELKQIFYNNGNKLINYTFLHFKCRFLQH
jgi:hypothetical protein